MAHVSESQWCHPVWHMYQNPSGVTQYGTCIRTPVVSPSMAHVSEYQWCHPVWHMYQNPSGVTQYTKRYGNTGAFWKFKKTHILCAFKDNFWKFSPYILFSKIPFFTKSRTIFKKISLFVWKRGHHPGQDFSNLICSTLTTRTLKFTVAKWCWWDLMTPYFFFI